MGHGDYLCGIGLKLLTVEAAFRSDGSLGIAGFRIATLNRLKLF
jgi:hypothetical protein